VTNPLAPLLELADVSAALDRARQAADAAMRHRALRRSGGQVAAEVGLRSAVASAALEGHGYELEQVRAGLVTDATLQGALRASAALDGLTSTWLRSPRQALARLHVLAARGVVDEAELGRPVADPAVSARLDALAELVVSQGGDQSGAPALLQAAVVHGELLALQAFAGPNGVVARAAGRLTLIAAGLDPRGLLAVEVGHQTREPEYVGSAGAFATGTPDGLRSWFRHYAAAVEVAAAELSEVCSATAG
jgi:Fic family protein